MKLNKTYLFEVLVNVAPAAGAKYNFPNSLGELNDVWVLGVEIYSADQLIATPLTYATTVSAAGQKSAMMVIVDEVTERIRQIPLVDLIPQLNGGLQREFVPFKASITKSYIELVSATGVTLNQGFVVNWLYSKEKPVMVHK